MTMIPVMQRLTVAKDGTGDCFNACVASILHMDLQETYAVLPHTPGVWFLNWRRWLEQRGWRLVLCSKLLPPKGYGIVSVYTNRVYPDTHPQAGERISHACVTLDGKIVHDPHPELSFTYTVQHYFSLTPITHVTS